jgi:hypothetical protein
MEANKLLQTRGIPKHYLNSNGAVKKRLDIGYDQAVFFIGAWIRILNGRWILKLDSIRIFDLAGIKLIDYWILPGFIEY